MRFFIFLLLFSVMTHAQQLPTGFSITPTAAPGSNFQRLNPNIKNMPNYEAGQAVAIKASNNHKEVLVLTSGFNRMYHNDGSFDINASSEYVFVYQVKKSKLFKKQVIKVPNTFYGIVWHPFKDAFYISGGVDDVIYYYEKEKGKYKKKNTIQLGHKAGLGVKIRPMAAELAINKNATLLAVSNLENDSISLIDTKTNKVINEIDLRPGRHNPRDKAKAGGEFPFGIIFIDNKLYVSSMRDYEVVVLDINNKKLKIIQRITVGSQPTRMLYNKKYNEIFVVNSRSDNISVIDAKKNKLKGSFYTIAPQQIFNRYHLKGANPNSIRLVNDTLYVTNGGTNSVAVIKLKHFQHNTTGDVIALYPTGWYPNDLEIIDGKLYVVNSNSLSGSNVGNCRDTVSISKDALLPCRGRNLHAFQTKKAGLLSMPLPHKKNIQDKLTLQVARNNHFFQDDNISYTILFLRLKIKHIIYVVKENRTYDQILGDLKIGNSDSNLTLFPNIITPNHHKIAKEFVTMDNFFDSGSASNDGWVWSTSGHTTEYTQKNIMINYAKRGLSYDNEGQNRNIPLAYGNVSIRRKFDPRVPNDPDLLPGIRDVASVDGDDEEPATGYIWNKALEAGLKVRNYGFFCDEERYFLQHDNPAYVKPSREPFKDKIIQAYPNKPALLQVTDLYFHGYDNNYPDLWRFNEFKREFDNYVKSNIFPNLVLVRFPHDHFGSFSTALAGVNTPLRQMSDNDYALGKLIELVSSSPFKDSTLIVTIEDDAQNGGDHVSAHRSICLVAGPYIKKNTLISTRYTTVNVLKTIELLLNIPPVGLNDALAKPMEDIFDIYNTNFNYNVEIPKILYKTDLELPSNKKPTLENLPILEHNSQYWQKVMKNQNFQSEDQLNVKEFNEALVKGIMNPKN